MATVRVSRALSPNSNVMRQVREQGARKIHAVAEQTARAAVRRADAIVSGLYDNHREPSRRRGNRRHLLGSFVGEVTSPRGVFPVVVRLRSLAPGVKVNSLNNGSRAHDITAKNAPFLVFPVKGTKWVRTKTVHHEERQGDHFMEQAMEEAVQATYHKAIRLPRR